VVEKDVDGLLLIMFAADLIVQEEAGGNLIFAAQRPESSGRFWEGDDKPETITI